MSGTKEVKDGVFAIELVGVRKAFKEVVAVDTVNLKIRSGEFFSLLGPSGCGKTTTLRMIAGLETPTGGTILLAGEDVTGVPAYHRNVNTVFQDYAIFPHMNVYENIHYPLRMRKIPRKEAHEKIMSVLKLVNMDGFQRRYSSQLSGGQRQRIALARALVNEPKALLLDEPLGALDFKLRVAMQSALKELQKKLSMTFVYVTHDQTEAITMSDRIAVMKSGSVHQVGTPDEIYNNPKTAFVASFIGEMNYIEGRVVETLRDRIGIDALGSTMRCVKGKYDMKKGDGALICVRPEKLCLNSGKKMANEVAAKLKSVVFRGEDYEVKTTLRGVELRAVFDHKEFRRLGGLRPDVKISWQADDAIVFPLDMKRELISY